jgi:hypothetical protein
MKKNYIHMLYVITNYTINVVMLCVMGHKLLFTEITIQDCKLHQ